MGRVLGAVWLYLSGVFAVSAGLYVFITMRHISYTHFSSSFIIMLFGLFVSGIGAARGRKILGSVPAQKTLSVVVSSEPEPAPKKIIPESLGEVRTENAEEKGKGTDKKPKKEPEDRDFLEIPMPEEEAVEIVICPKCGTANQKGHKYCYNCGEKLKHTKPRKRKE